MVEVVIYSQVRRFQLDGEPPNKPLQTDSRAIDGALRALLLDAAAAER